MDPIDCLVLLSGWPIATVCISAFRDKENGSGFAGSTFDSCPPRLIGAFSEFLRREAKETEVSE